MLDLKIILARLLQIFTTEIFVGDITNDVQLDTYTLDSSSSDSAWLQGVVKTLCRKYPNKTGLVFKGIIVPNSRGYFEVCIYDTNMVNSSTGLPQYCFGTWRHWQNTFAVFSTNAYSFSYVAK